MNIYLAQPSLHIGNFEANTQKIIAHIEEAAREKADLAVFCELAVCGYPPEDFLRYEAFTDQCLASIEEIAAHCREVPAIVGGISKNTEKGVPLFNSAFYLNKGRIEKVIHKNLLPWYDVFNEYRYFAPAPADQNPVIDVNGKKYIVTLCEDIWDVDLADRYQEDYTGYLMQFYADGLINLAASPFSAEQPHRRESILKKVADKLQMPVYYVNQLGAHTDLIFDGASAVAEPDKGSVHILNRFQEDSFITGRKHNEKPAIPSKPALLHDALIYGVEDFFRKNNFTRALIGLSGGIDSALVYYFACRALGTENVTPVMLPSDYTSQRSLDEASQLVDNMGGKLEEISISNIQNSFLNELAPHFQGTSPGVAEENLQARTRGVILMALSNKWGSVLLNTTNKSEIAVGYGTLYGDLCGGLSVIGDLYKKDVYAVCEYANEKGELIPRTTIERPPTAELKHDQKDTDSLPPYPTLDAILEDYINHQESPAKIIEKGYDPQTVREVVAKVEKNEFKRHQSSPVLRVSDKAFGRGRLIPIVAKI